MNRMVLVLIATLALAAPALAISIPDSYPEPFDPLPNAGSTDPALVGAWDAPFEGQVPAISLVLLNDGRVLYWGGVEASDYDQVFFLAYPTVADIGIMSPPYTAATATKLDSPEGMGDLFCAGQTILPDGRVLTGGGSEWKTLGEDFTGFVDGEEDAWTYDPDTSSWTRESDMNVKRWYPTLITLANGNALAASGIEHLPQPQSLNVMHETWDGAAWSPLAGANNTLPMYPRLFTVPGGPMKGDLFYETSGTLWGPFGEHPLEPAWSLEQRLDLDTNTWSVVGPSVFGARQHAATVMLPLSPEDAYRPRILTFGGSIGRSEVASPLSEITTLGDEVRHDITEPLAHPRWHVNGVLLPDGNVLAVGGGLLDNVYAHGQRSPPVLTAELFDPRTGQWSQMADMSVGRTYHSTALLLPDGRVLAGGHVPLPVPWLFVRENMPYQDQIAETRFEIYSPPYLFWGARPTITSAPATVAYGGTFTIETPDAAVLHSAVLVHPGSTTHAWDSSQRVVELAIEGRGVGTLTLRAPPDSDVAVSGDWMLFVRQSVEGKGLVPSVASWVHLG